MPANETLVAELAAAMHAAVDGANCDCSPGAREEFATGAEAALALLRERGLLVPDGAETREEHGMRLTWPDGHQEVHLARSRDAAEDAVAWHREQIAKGGPLGSADVAVRRVITTPWTTEEPCR